jgi:hypothetical protein
MNAARFAADTERLTWWTTGHQIDCLKFRIVDQPDISLDHVPVSYPGDGIASSIGY